MLSFTSMFVCTFTIYVLVHITDIQFINKYALEVSQKVLDIFS